MLYFYCIEPKKKKRTFSNAKSEKNRKEKMNISYRCSRQKEIKN